MENTIKQSMQDNKDNYDVFTCPSCKTGKFSSVADDAGNETLSCRECGATYPVINNVPRLVKLDNYSESFGYQWNIHNKTQLDSYSGLPVSRNRLCSATGWEKNNLDGMSVLEAGSGAGRFTEILVETNAKIFSFDYSIAVDANASNNGAANNLTLFQGDIFNIPFDDKSFDHVVCLGVIQHTPDPEAAFFSLASKVKSGGHLYIDVYTRSLVHYLHWKYILRPLTMRINREVLYTVISKVVPFFVPPAIVLRKLFGRAGARLVPIVEFSHLGLSPELNKEWAILDTFDMYSPAHDHPQSKRTVIKWFERAGFENIEVWYGDNGVVGRGRKL